MTIQELLAESRTALNTMQDLHRRRAQENRDFTPDELVQFDKADADYNRIIKLIEEERKMQERETAVGELSQVTEQSFRHTPEAPRQGKEDRAAAYQSAFLSYAMYSCVPASEVEMYL